MAAWRDSYLAGLVLNRRHLLTLSLTQAPACTGGPNVGWMTALVSPLRPQAVQPLDPGKAPEPGHGDSGSRWGAWRSFLRRLRLCGGAPEKHRAQAGSALPQAACAALPETPAAGDAAQRVQGACALGVDPGRGLQGAPGAGAPDAARSGGGARACAPADTGAGSGAAAHGDEGLADSAAAAAAVVGRTSEWEAFLANHTHDWEFTAKAPNEDGERRGAAPRRRRHGGEHARPGARQRDTSFYATMVSTPATHALLALCPVCSYVKVGLGLCLGEPVVACHAPVCCQTPPHYPMPVGLLGDMWVVSTWPHIFWSPIAAVLPHPHGVGDGGAL